MLQLNAHHSHKHQRNPALASTSIWAVNNASKLQKYSKCSLIGRMPLQIFEKGFGIPNPMDRQCRWVYAAQSQQIYLTLQPKQFVTSR